jgi:hypothetical protein
MNGEIELEQEHRLEHCSECIDYFLRCSRTKLISVSGFDNAVVPYVLIILSDAPGSVFDINNAVVPYVLIILSDAPGSRSDSNNAVVLYVLIILNDAGGGQE